MLSFDGLFITGLLVAITVTIARDAIACISHYWITEARAMREAMKGE